MSNSNPKSDDAAALRQRIGDAAFDVTQNKGTERPFTGSYLDHKADGTYQCVVCHQPLFRSEHKYDSGSGWPSFFLPLAKDNIRIERDTSHGMIREEVLCANCGAHLGHVFPDGPGPEGARYCINSVALGFDDTEEGSDQ
ncbi:MAG: peptide-methionine (R)-S-oxide reductase MsrB [Pseudomonadota bacterium]